MDDKQVSNYPIQGTSFHLLLYALIMIERWMKKKKFKSKICLEVHDSGIFDCVEEETIPIAKKFKEITHDLINKFPWLAVPMDSEPDISERNGSFAKMDLLEI